ncbi:hypothetical protein HK102_000757 [Quaeritorhiza haematococci]|nr:hypothetical protein HK102_000757 [Quaeritorhiza haematococci]
MQPFSSSLFPSMNRSLNKKDPVLRAWTAIRTLLIAILAITSLYLLASYGAEDAGFEEDLVDEEMEMLDDIGDGWGLGALGWKWTGFGYVCESMLALVPPYIKAAAKRVKMLAVRPVDVDGAVTIAGITVSVWALFVTIELAAQLFGMAYRHHLKSTQPDFAQDFASEMAARLSALGLNQNPAAPSSSVFSPQKIGEIVRTFGSYQAVWATLVDDLSTFVFVCKDEARKGA